MKEAQFCAGRYASRMIIFCATMSRGALRRSLKRRAVFVWVFVGVGVNVGVGVCVRASELSVCTCTRTQFLCHREGELSLIHI